MSKDAESGRGMMGRIKKATTISRSRGIAATQDMGDGYSVENSAAAMSLPSDRSARVIDLGAMNLPSLPAELADYKQVEVLSLRANRLTSLPASIGNLHSLRQLTLAENSITELPIELTQLTTLSELDLRKNKLSRLPADVGKLTSLQKLFLRSNQLSSLPLEIGDLVQLESLLLKNNHLLGIPETISKLTNLQILDLNSNELRTLHKSVGRLKYLRDLDVQHNHLSALPPLKKCAKHLHSLKLGYNNFSEIPDAVLELRHLRLLDVEGNNVSVLPADLTRLVMLEDLVLSKNRFVELTAVIGQLSTLRRLSVMDNALPDLPLDHCKKLVNLEELDVRNTPMCTQAIGSGDWKKLLVHLPKLKTLQSGVTHASAVAGIKMVSSIDTGASSSTSGSTRPVTVSVSAAKAGSDEPPLSLMPGAPSGKARGKTDAPGSIFDLFGTPGAADATNGGSPRTGGGSTLGERITPRRAATLSVGDLPRPDGSPSSSSSSSSSSKPKKSVKLSESGGGGGAASGGSSSTTTADALGLGLNISGVNYDSLLASLSSASDPDAPASSGEVPPSPSGRRGVRSSRRGALISGFTAVEDVNVEGLKRAKKKSVQVKGSSLKPVFQQEDMHFASFPWCDEKRALFCVWDGHAGSEAAVSALEHFPQQLDKLLKLRHKDGRLPKDLGEVWAECYIETDNLLRRHEYVGSTSTTVMVWRSSNDRYLQSANVGDSRSYLCGKTRGCVALSRDHKLTIDDEKQRIVASGVAINDGQTRLNGIAVTRALGDWFAKDSNSGLIAVPYVSEAIKLTDDDELLLVASDGLWDIVSGQKAYEICQGVESGSTEEMASRLLSTATQSPKCVDNVTVIVVRL